MRSLSKPFPAFGPNAYSLSNQPPYIILYHQPPLPSSAKPLSIHYSSPCSLLQFRQLCRCSHLNQPCPCCFSTNHPLPLSLTPALPLPVSQLFAHIYLAFTPFPNPSLVPTSSQNFLFIQPTLSLRLPLISTTIQQPLSAFSFSFKPPLPTLPLPLTRQNLLQPPRL